MTDRLAAMRAMVAQRPDNPLARFGLANELLKARAWAEAAEHLRAYLAAYDDEGNGWGRLAEALEGTGDLAGARDALVKGIEASQRFGHGGMAAELEARLDDLAG